VRRHADDAAFYWRQLDGAQQSVLLGAVNVAEFQSLLLAHLEGLQAAGEPGAIEAQQALARWRKPGEAFAAMTAALALPNDDDQQSEAIGGVLRVVSQAPDLLLRGVISALAWAPPAQAEPWMAQALRSDNAVHRVAALRACALRGLYVPQWSAHAQHASPFVRAAACRWAEAEHVPTLEALAADADLVVRAEAALAWCRLVPAGERDSSIAAAIASHLWECVRAQIGLAGAATGWNRLQAQRRLDRWLHQLAWLAPLGHPGIAALLPQLPVRLALNFALHHGDAEQLPFVLQCMQQDDHARWAGWVWQCLTGVDLRRCRLARPDPAVDLDAPLTSSQLDADHGLPLPDAAAVAAHPACSLRLASGERLLMGQPVHAHALRDLLAPEANRPQALRHVAAYALGQLHPQHRLNLRADPDAQQAVLARMGLNA
jgi:uncharacterized protein (TIGR02270 family)